MSKLKEIYKNNLFLIWILFFGIFLRVYYLIRKSGDIFVANLGGDPCYHYNVAYNISNGIGPKTSFILSKKLTPQGESRPVWSTRSMFLKFMKNGRV